MKKIIKKNPTAPKKYQSSGLPKKLLFIHLHVNTKTRTQTPPHFPLPLHPTKESPKPSNMWPNGSAHLASSPWFHLTELSIYLLLLTGSP